MPCPLPRGFYLSEDVLALSQKLLGKSLFTCHQGVITGGMIVETEAYCGVGDRASHAYGGRCTERNRVMYQEGGVAYVYLCYGIHHLFNVVSNRAGIPHAILVRAIEPQVGLDVMRSRRGKERVDHTLTAGPGALAQALAIDLSFNGIPLVQDLVWIEESVSIPPEQIIASPRVGVAYAGQDAHQPWRFRVVGSAWTSRAK